MCVLAGGRLRCALHELAMGLCVVCGSALLADAGGKWALVLHCGRLVGHPALWVRCEVGLVLGLLWAYEWVVALLCLLLSVGNGH